MGRFCYFQIIYRIHNHVIISVTRISKLLTVSRSIFYSTLLTNQFVCTESSQNLRNAGNRPHTFARLLVQLVLLVLLVLLV